MKQAITTNKKTQSDLINRYGYILFLILVIYQAATGDLEWAVANLGIALIFDPFDSSVKWQDRLLYQKLWMIFHLLLVAAGFVYLLVR